MLMQKPFRTAFLFIFGNGTAEMQTAAFCMSIKKKNAFGLLFSG